MNNGTYIYDYQNVKRIIVSGDIHGDYEKLVYKFCVQYQMTDTLVVVSGDCGFGFHKTGYYDTLYQKACKRLAKNNNWIVFVRGNHDNPAYFDGQQVNYKRWKAVPDYSVIKACGHTILCVGGAISVDRTWRMYESCIKTDDGKLTPYVYWPDEKPVYDESLLENISKSYSIDTVITHTAPSFCEKINSANIQDWIAKDENLLEDVKNERKIMDKIFTYLKEHNHPLHHWYYGHFHESWHSEFEDIKFNMLDILELRELK